MLPRQSFFQFHNFPSHLLFSDSQILNQILFISLLKCISLLITYLSIIAINECERFLTTNQN